MRVLSILRKFQLQRTCKLMAASLSTSKPTANVYLQVVGTETGDTSPSLYLFAESQRYADVWCSKWIWYLLFILIFSLSRHLVTLNIYFDLKFEVTFGKNRIYWLGGRWRDFVVIRLTNNLIDWITAWLIHWFTLLYCCYAQISFQLWRGNSEIMLWTQTKTLKGEQPFLHADMLGVHWRSAWSCNDSEGLWKIRHSSSWTQHLVSFHSCHKIFLASWKPEVWLCWIHRSR